MKPPLEISPVLHENEAEAFLASIVESSDDAIFGMKLDGTVVSWNRAAEEMYGYTAEEIVGRPVYLLSPPERAGEMVANLEKLRRRELIPPFETVRTRKDSRLIEVSVRVSLIKDTSGAVTGVAVIARDISEQKRAREAALLSGRMKQQFLDNMSHEIRTPLNGILGMTDLVLDTELTDEQRDNLGLVKISAESLLAAIDDILDFSQIEAGKLEMESIPFDIRESLGETMKILGYRAHNKGLELIYDVEPEIPRVLLGDPGRIRRIIHNLVGNAIKFTERGEILLTVRQESRSTGSVGLQMSVKDTGIGIPKEMQQTIFEPFTQADGSRTRKHGGTGLGLAIVGKLVKLMHGEIRLESEPGKGTTFHITLQLQVKQGINSNSEHLDFDGLRGISSLIVDDNSVNRRVLRRMLNRWGMKVADVARGNAALDALRIARDIGHPFQLVLLDGYMREMDGFSIAAEIRKDSSIAGATIMMLTSVGHIGEAARCRDLGIAAYLVKPVGLSELADAICFALEKAVGTEGTPLVTRHFLREARTRLQGMP